MFMKKKKNKFKVTDEEWNEMVKEEEFPKHHDSEEEMGEEEEKEEGPFPDDEDAIEEE